MASSRRARNQKKLRATRRRRMHLERLEKRYALNAAPVLNDAITPLLQPVAFDAGPPVSGVLDGSTLVSDIIDAGGVLDNFADADGDPAGIAITGTKLSGGTLWYTIDAGVTWTDVGDVSPSQARLLSSDANTRLYFQPASDSPTPILDAISFRAWDGSNGLASGSADVNADLSLSVDSLTSIETSNYNYHIFENPVDGRTYVADGVLGVSVYDAGDWSNPTNLGYWDDSGVSSAVQFLPNGTTALVIDGNNQSLSAVDFSTVSPSLESLTPNDAMQVGVHPSLPLVAAYVSGTLNIRDYTDPANPVSVGSVQLTTDPTDWCGEILWSSDGNTLYVAGYNLYVIDASSTSVPQVQKLSLPGAAFTAGSGSL